MGSSSAPRGGQERLLRAYRPRSSAVWAARRRWVLAGAYVAWFLGTRGRRCAKRAFDLVIGSVMLLLALPLMAVIAALIRLESPGPVLFRQQRAGQWGKPFTCYKFRSMHVDAEERRAALERFNEATGPVFKMRRDPRVTRIGRVLRELSLDELAQVFNVLNGTMSLVGPRPPLLSEVEQYTLEHRERLGIKPGITCIWQVSGRSEVDFERWVQMDLQYIEGQSLWMDVKLLLRTIPAVLFRRGAY